MPFYLDAPVSGGEIGAKAGMLTIMLGGPAETFEKVRPLFALMGKSISLVGANGAGQTCKVANQIIVALTIEAVAEALLFASKAGIGSGTVSHKKRLPHPALTRRGCTTRFQLASGSPR